MKIALVCLVLMFLVSIRWSWSVAAGSTAIGVEKGRLGLAFNVESDAMRFFQVGSNESWTIEWRPTIDRYRRTLYLLPLWIPIGIVVGILMILKITSRRSVVDSESGRAPLVRRIDFSASESN